MCALLPLMGAAGAADSPKTKIQICKDASGRPIATDPADPRCYKPPPTEEETALTEEAKRKAKEAYLACMAEQRSNQGLVKRYPSKAKHDAARQQALEDVAAAQRTSAARTRKLSEDRKHLLDEAEFYPDGKLPAKLRRDIDTNSALLEAQRQAAAKQAEDAAQINRFYDEELKTLRTLWLPQSAARPCVAPSD